MTDPSDVSQIRREYRVSGLDRDNLNSDPFEQFRHWLDQAVEADPGDATSMTLATADAQGVPSARIVLLKGYDARGFVWYTNYQSEKGQQLNQNPVAELLFYWPSLERQVRIQGRVVQVSRAETLEYFGSRPTGSQIGALASEQSASVESREALEKRVRDLELQYQSTEIPCPDHWGGYRLEPHRFEFWQGRESRLHDRFRFTKEGDLWSAQRLQP